MWVELVDYHRGLAPGFAVPPDLESGLLAEIDRGLERSGRQLQIAETRTGPIGFSLCAVTGESSGAGESAGGWIHELWVAPDRRGGGVGTRLVQGAVSFLRGHGVERISVRVEALNSAGLAFWHRRGFADRARILEHGGFVVEEP